jgi:aspartate racemase
MMKTIGLIGGMSWESSKVYYELINRKTREELGGFHSGKCILYSVDFAEIESLQKAENWSELDHLMSDAARKLELAGADVIVLCTNTMHLCSEAIISGINIPFLHIAQATGADIEKKGLKKIALLGTKFTMEKDFYSSYLSAHFGIEVITPEAADRLVVHNIIYKELVKGKINAKSRIRLVKIIDKLARKGAEGVILGCTELPLIISDSDVAIPVFDTTKIHAENAVEWALGK